jgi:hypothetical protein
MKHRSALLISSIILLIACTNAVYAQTFRYFDKNLSENNTIIGFNVDQKFATNSLTSGFVLDYLNGKFITEESKNRCIANFKNNQVKAGELFNLGLSIQQRLGKSNNFLYLEIGETFFYETQFHEDIFILLFKGNKSFENKTASINPLWINSHQYFYAKLGLHKYTNRIEFKWNVAYAGGQRLLELQTQRGGLFTATDGRFIQLDLKLSSHDVNPLRNSLFTISGHGIFTDIMLNYQLNNKTEIGGGIEGFGFINWQEDVKRRDVDTLYRFDGFEVSDVLDSFSIDIKNPQELRSSFIKEQSDVRKKTTLPHIIYIQFSQFIIPDIFQIRLKYGIRNSDVADNFLAGMANLYVAQNKLIGLHAEAGGYGKFSVGAQFAMCFSNRSCIQIYFNSLSNLFVPSKEMNLTGGLMYRRAL